MNSDNYVIIMAGGVGSRFWPYSRKSHPKQFHDILGTGKTMLQQCAERFEGICSKGNIYVVTNAAYKQLVLDSIPYLSDDQILLEPEPKNTAPCIAYAVYKILSKNPQANFVVTPSDQFVLKEKEFEKTVNKALDYTKSNNDFVTIGIVPTRPDTGYGYIQYDKGDKSEIKKVIRFAEKPNEQTALQFLASGDFVWNAGMFIFNGTTIKNAFEKYMPDLKKAFAIESYYLQDERKNVNEIYAKCVSISFDYGIMEKVDNVCVTLGYFGWSDVGTWKSLYDLRDKNSDGNVLDGNILVYDSQNNIIKAPKDKLVVVNGLEGYIVAESEGILMICKKDEEQKVKQFVEDLKKSSGDKYI
ncbi:MAG: sugar phosphate nucleotidyltransferase [Bacteroidota bacterium]|nr:sugar phosphate nucleotidyltransferase [Bacteroidota bacterium]